MNRAVALARDAASSVFQTFDYYVDPVGGSDGATGKRSAPFASLAHGLSVATAGQSIGVKRGTTHRTAATLTTTVGKITVGAYGVGAKPIITGGLLVTGWTAVPSYGSGTEDMGDTFTATAGTLLTAHTSDVGSATWAKSAEVGNGYVTASGRIRQSDTNKVRMNVAAPVSTSEYDVEADLFVAGLSGAATTFISGRSVGTTGSTVNNYVAGWSGATWMLGVTAAGVTTTLGSAAVTVVAGNTYHLLLRIRNGFKALYVDGTLVASSTNNTQTAQGLPGIYMGAMASPSDSAGLQLDNFKVSEPGDTASSTYVATLASAPAGTPGMVVAGSTALTLGSSSTGLTSNQWFWSSSALYVNLGGANPTGSTVEVASVSNVFSFGTAGQTVTIRDLDIRFGVDHAVLLSTVGKFVVDRCNFLWIVYAANSGVVDITGCTAGGRVIRSTFDQLLNDGVWIHNSPNVEVAYNVMTNIGWLPGDVQSDGIQVEESFGGVTSSSGLWIHHNTITTGTATPKGCVIVNVLTTGSTAAGIVEHNLLTGGNYGVAIHASNLVVRNNTMLSQVSTFGGGIHVAAQDPEINDVQVYRNLVVGSNRSGIIFQNTTTARRRWLIANNTFVNHGWGLLTIQAPISGAIANNILWATAGLPSFAIIQNFLGTASGDTLTWDYNTVVDSGGAGLFKGPSATYTSLAAWKTGAGVDAHSTSSDPLLTTDGRYTLGSGSPARDAGTTVTGVTDGFLGLAPDIGYAEVA